MDYAAAFALALAGDVARSRALADDLAKNFPEDTSVQYLYLPTLRALFALTRVMPAAAIQSLQTASRYDLGLGRPRLQRVFRRRSIRSTFAARRTSRRINPAQAAAEFQRIVDHRGIVLVDPMDAMARLQLARALVALGRHREGEKRLHRSLDAVEECRPRDSGSQGSKGRICATSVSCAFPRTLSTSQNANRIVA